MWSYTTPQKGPSENRQLCDRMSSSACAFVQALWRLKCRDRHCYITRSLFMLVPIIFSDKSAQAPPSEDAAVLHLQEVSTINIADIVVSRPPKRSLHHRMHRTWHKDVHLSSHQVCSETTKVTVTHIIAAHTQGSQTACVTSHTSSQAHLPPLPPTQSSCLL